MGYYHTKIHSCITVNGDSAYLGNRMALQTLTGTEMRELDVSAATSQSVDAPDQNGVAPFDRCA
ncbi:MAG: hypothetical protein IPK59_22355 [Rhodospirillaceae bacterium]|nr:hypothetical protein [Rhodospirillaceae bacterium]